MFSFRFFLILILLLSGGSTTYLYASELEQFHFDDQIEAQFSEDFGGLSPSHLSTSKDFLNNGSTNYSTNFKYEENTRVQSKTKAYFSINRFIEPGLSLPDIIFPFHIFL